MDATPTQVQIEEIRGAAAAGDVAQAAERLGALQIEPAEVRGLFGSMSVEVSAAILGVLREERAAEFMVLVPPEHAAEILGQMDAPKAASLLASLHSDTRADLLSLVHESAREAITPHLPADVRADLARLMRYPPETAGGLMETELLAFPAEATVGDVIRNLRANQQRYAEIGVQYLYVIDDSRRLLGVAPMRDLLMAPEDAKLESLPRNELVSVRDTATTRELADVFDTHPYQGMPVVDAAGGLLGTVNRADVTESEHHQSEEQYRRSQGIVGGEELRTMSVLSRLRRRGAWLGINLVLCLGGAAIIALQQGTIAKALVVAAILPVISATSGNAAMQAAAVSIRELTLGVLDPGSWRRVLWHEGMLAALLAVPLGLAVALLARVWGAGGDIGLAVGVAMGINTLLAIGIGSVCPLVLRRLQIDPALASGPITTTVADITGFALTLTLVSVLTD